MRDFGQRHGVRLWIEPGKAVVGEAGQLVAEVIDCFERDGQAVAVLDTGVHHLPEVFEYQRAPRLREHTPDGGHVCQLAGGSCLAGDLFGTYRFRQPLAVGDRVVFEGVGAYALVKASRFNGHELPAVYLRDRHGALRQLKVFDFADYQRQWG